MVSAKKQNPTDFLDYVPLWDLNIEEIVGHNLEVRGRRVVNRLLQKGWKLLHVYTLHYKVNGVWRERPMAILGRLKNISPKD